MPRLMSYMLPVFALSLVFAGCVQTEAQETDDAFKKNPVFESFGAFAPVEADMVIPMGKKFAMALDAAEGGSTGEMNKKLNTAARFMNMHVDVGVQKRDIRVAIVFHGKAALDVTQDGFYSGKYDGAKNASTNAIEALTSEGVRVILCGQSAAYHGITKDDLVPGVEMALSAMTAHALLQQEGYTLNPF